MQEQTNQFVVSVCRLVSLGDVLTVPAENHPDLLQNNSEGIHRYKQIRLRSPCVFVGLLKSGEDTHVTDFTVA